jgi:hypothetical protein
MALELHNLEKAPYTHGPDVTMARRKESEVLNVSRRTVRLYQLAEKNFNFRKCVMTSGNRVSQEAAVGEE